MKKIRLVAATVAALVVIIICFAGLSGNSGGDGDKQSTKEAQVSVVVAAKSIPAYSVMSADMLSVVDIPQSAVRTQGNTYQNIDDVVGSIALSDIAQNETILSNHVRDSKNATVTPSIDANMRAITIGVTDVTGVANLIRAGNKVDVFFTAEDPDHSSQAQSVLLLEDITVLALDQQVSDSKNPNASADATTGTKNADAYETATLHVSPEQATKLTAASKKGMLWLALRNQSDNGTYGEISSSTYDIL